jgi:hypothetical protein
MFVCWEDYEDWCEEQTLLEFENEFTHVLDFEAWEAEVVTAAGKPLGAHTR